MMTSIQTNLKSLRTQLRASEQKFQRIPNSVKILAVSKGQSLEKIQQAITTGQTIFGENYLQEALSKIEALKYKNLEWHFIGPIQSNKTKKIAENFDWVQSVDNIRIAQRLNDQRPGHLPPLNICIEVNVSNESSKSGININELEKLVDFCLSQPRLKLRGLMTIPKPTQTFEEQRAEFHKLKLLYEKLLQKNILLDTLSMGMSDDWEAAVAEGSTLIRIGTAIFGART